MDIVLIIIIVGIVIAIPFINFPTLNSVYYNYNYLNLEFFFNTWKVENFGTYGFYAIPYDIYVWYVFKNLPHGYANIASYITIQYIAAFSAYKLSKYLYVKKHIAIVCTFFYVYSIYAQFMSGWPVHSGSMVYALLPLFVYIFLVINKTNILQNLSYLSLMFFLLIGINLTYIAYIFICVFFVYIYKILIDIRNNIKINTIALLACVAIYIVTNAMYFTTSMSQTFLDAKFLTSSLAAESIEWKSSGSKLSEVLREMGSVNFIYEYNGKFAYPNARKYFDSSLLILFSYYITLLFIIALLLPHRQKHERIAKNVVLVLAVFILFLALGVNNSSPTKEIYRFVVTTVPYFKIFRDSYKATVVIHVIYMLSLGYVVYKAYYLNRTKRYIHILLLVGIYTSIVLLSSTYWLGRFFIAETVSVPAYWNELGKTYSLKHRNDKIFMTPNMQLPVYVFIDKTVGSSTFYRPLLMFNTLNPNMVFQYSSTTNQIYKTLKQETLGLYNVPLVLNQYDVHWRLYKSTNPSQVKNLLEQNGYTLLNRYE